VTGRFFVCRGLDKRFGELAVLEGVGLELPRHGLVSLLGPSGAGKTTLFHILAGVDRPDAGRVLLDGADITGLPGRVSYMPQKDLLFAHLTALDNACLPLLVRRVPKKQARETARPYFSAFGLEGFEDKYPHQLSGGMRQRAALLRTCLMKNPVILLDEPFSALDAITRLRMRAWFLDIARDMELSTLFITHDVDEAITLSDTVYILSGRPGRILAQVTVPALRPRSADFSLSPVFAEVKRKILTVLGLMPAQGILE
jgi:ABC-type nitrate/sulfonate/bicarbonate transport system ATPase subunit